MMRRALFMLVLGVLLLSAVASAQQKGFEITPLFNYVWTSRVNTYEGQFDIANSGSWGVLVGIDIENYTYKGTTLELLYNRQDTKAEFYEAGTRLKEDLFDMSVDYYQIGVMNRLFYDKVEPFGEFLLGATRFSAKDDITVGSDTFRPSDEWMFSITLGAGVRLMLSDRIGLRGHGRLLMPLRFSGGGLFCGFGGCSVGVGSSSMFLQGDLGLGLIVRF
jgi:opacity protein-like surface antigen